MAIKLTHITLDSMELQDFMDYAEAHTNFADQDSQLELSLQLSMLGNNRVFLTKFMGEYIERYLHAAHAPSTISQAFILASRKEFYVRAAFWLPDPGLTANEVNLYAYHQAHDHNFDFLSYAYCGSGYRTDLYEYDYNTTAGYMGEQVKINPLGLHHHSTGDVLFYRCNKDIHFQRPPDSASITINVISLVNQHGLRDQYFFDIPSGDSEVGTIYRYAEGNIEGRRSLFNALKYVRSPKISRILADVVQSYPCQRTRYEALRCLKTNDLQTHDELCKIIESDASPILHHYLHAERHL